MNPLTNVKNIAKLNETELSTGLIHKKSWHDIYKDSAWIFIGGLEYGLTEGDILTVFSQYGEIVNLNLVRDKKTGKSKGFCFLCYANQKSTVLAVDNLNGIKLCKRTIRVDHVQNYKPPKENDKDDEITKMLKSQGCAPQVLQKNESDEVKAKKKSKKEKKEKKRKKEQKSNSDASDSEKGVVTDVRIKKEKHDPGYDKYDTSSRKNQDLNKRKHQKDSLGHSRGESSHTGENSQSTRHRSYRDDFLDKNISQIKREPESDNDDNMHSSFSKRHKRQRSSSSPSSDHHVRTNRDSNGHRKDRTRPKKQAIHKKNYNSNVSSSSSDDGQGENMDKNYDRRKRSDYASTENQHFSKEKRHPKHKLRTKYRSDDSDDSSHNNSHYKNKYCKK